MKQLSFFLSVSFLCSITIAQNQAPIITNYSGDIDEVNEQLIINYDLQDAENDDVEISFNVTDNHGKNFLINTANATGDVGFPITAGSSKKITWNYNGLITNIASARIRLIADDRQSVDIQAIVNEVDSNRMITDLTYLTSDIRNRSVNPTFLNDCKDYIEQVFDDNSLYHYRHEFTFGNYTAHNLIANLQGVDDEQKIWIIDAHYDAVSNTPGADDNGSGTVGMLEALRVLSKYNFNSSIKFIGFDLEEPGLIGSEDYVTNGGIESYEQIIGAINYEMIGYYSEEPNSQTTPFGFDQLFPQQYQQTQADNFRGNFITNVSNSSSSTIMNSFEINANTYVPDLKVISLKERSGFPVSDLRRRDHASFWDNGYRAIMLTDGAENRNTDYHTPNDTMGQLSFTFMSNVVKATVATIAELAQVKHSTSVQFGLYPTGVSNNKKLAHQISVFPNPVNDYFTIKIPQLNHTKTIRITDLQGKIIIERELLSNVEKLSLSADNLQSGSYFIILSNDNQTLALQKLLVTH